MEIKKQNIHMNYEKASAMSQITLDDDYNLPDYRPDIYKKLNERLLETAYWKQFS